MKRFTCLLAASSLAFAFYLTTTKATAQTQTAASSYARCSYTLPDGWERKVFAAVHSDGDQLQFDPTAFSANAIAVIAKVTRPAFGININSGTYRVSFLAEATGPTSSSAEIEFRVYAGGSVNSEDYDYVESQAYFEGNAHGYAVGEDSTGQRVSWYLDIDGINLPVAGSTSFNNNNTGVLDAYAESSPFEI